MHVQKIAEGFWRWTVPHPDWKPEFDRPGGGGWAEVVGCVYAEIEGRVVLIDPLLPPEADRSKFWDALDRDVARARGRALILIGSVDHGRSADEIATRYRGEVIGDPAIRDNVSCELQATFDEIRLPRGVVALPVVGMSPGERAFWLEPWKAAVFADAVIGTGNGHVRVAPPSWGIKTEAGRATYENGFRASLRAIADLRPEILLPSHGEPVLTAGAASLDDALNGPAWGE
ncbi:MAG TPA: hypothetical protein VFV19_10910 [Candidatus Polarisedimenticolaceae bacterium]|nr:hypothetical protein [Candidatus Polarisedimenticolaceae bacterium]